MIDHVSLGVRDLASSRGFYEAVLAPLGYTIAMQVDDAVGFHDGRNTDLWIVPADGNGLRDVFVRDRRLGTTTRVSASSMGNVLPSGRRPRISHSLDSNEGITISDPLPRWSW